MTFDWNDFQDLAKSLESNPAIPGPVEAALRSAASRAYYAAYNCALDYALTEDFVPTDRGSIHKQLQDYFQSKGISRPQYKKIGINLNRLKIRREEADYCSRPFSLIKMDLF